MRTWYAEAVRSFEAGTITEIILPLAYDDADLRAVAVGREAYGAAWRRDLDFFTSPAARELLERHGARLTTWRELGRLLR